MAPDGRQETKEGPHCTIKPFELHKLPYNEPRREADERVKAELKAELGKSSREAGPTALLADHLGRQETLGPGPSQASAENASDMTCWTADVEVVLPAVQGGTPGRISGP